MDTKIADALALLFDTGQVVELRALFGDATASGYYDDMARLAADVENVEGACPKGIYVTLNELDPALLSRSSNRIRMRLGKKDPTTGDENIRRRRWFPVDIDAVRASGVSSSDAEHAEALDKAARIARYLTDEGWPEPVLGDSGNGAHLLYAIDLPNDTESTDLVKRGLLALALLFNDRSSTVDTANHNASRIWKLYGTVSRKGDNTKTRPHRRSELVSVPGSTVRVSKEQLTQLAESTKPIAETGEKRRSPAGQGIDLGRWLRDHAIGIADEKPYQGGVLFTLDECPFSGAHRDGSFAIQFPSGAVYAGCHHSSCGGGIQRWPELRQKFEPTEDQKRTVSVNKPPPPPGAPGPCTPLPAADVTTLPHYDEAMAVLQHGDPLKAMLLTFSLDHVGDEIPAECLVMSLASRSVENTNGLHVSVSGESGKGKSDTFNKILLQVPEQVKLEGAMSNKFLFYKDDMKPGTVIVFDDKNLSEEMQEILKGSTSSFKKPIIYRTVSKDRKAVVCRIPERCLWWVAKVEGSGDDQVFNRMLTCWIDDSPEQDASVLEDMAKKEEEPPGLSDSVRPEVLTCRAMWEIIGNERVHVSIPFARRIGFQTKTNRRNPEMFYSLIKAHAALFFMQREQHCNDGGSPFIEATLADFEAAARLFGMLNGTTGGQETKLTRRESELLTAIAKDGQTEFTVQQIQELMGLSYSAVYKLLHGYRSRETLYSGLLEKCPAISFIDRTVTTDDEIGQGVKRRANAYQFNPDIYRSWSSGGAVWLESRDDHNDHNDHDEAGNSAVGSTFSATAANIIEEESGAETGNGLYNKNIYSNNSTKGSNSEDTSPPVSAGGLARVCACDPGSAANETDKGVINLPILKSPSQTCDNPGSTFRKPADPAANDPHLQQISSRDYKLLDYPESHTRCSVCGHKGTEYIEKLTPERKARVDKSALRICRVCYKTAQKREQGEVPPLPGILAIGRMVRISNDIGRCQVCNLGKAVYRDPPAGTSICQQCYDREARAAGSAEGGVGR